MLVKLRASRPVWRIGILVIVATQPLPLQATDLLFATRADAVIVLDGATGLVINEIPLVDAAPISPPATNVLSHGTKMYLIRRAGNDIITIDIVSGVIEASRMAVQCCLTGAATIVRERLYVVSEEFFKQTLAVYDLRDPSGRPAWRVPIPEDIVTLIPRFDVEDASCCGDCDRDGEVTVDEIVRAVSSALVGCQESADDGQQGE